MIKALALTGPTASGKTALSLDIAERLGCEIISLDSMQIYRGMDIGTAKATKEEQARVPHHMIDIISPLECYNTESYRADALRCAEGIIARGKTPLFVGGTGLYIDTLMRTAPVSPESNAEISERLMKLGETDEGREALYDRLIEIDPESALKTHKNNLRRVVRALEIYEITGKTKSYFDKLTQEGEPDVRAGMITLDFHDRDNLYSRVDKRVDIMLGEGLLEEARALYDSGLLMQDTTAASAIGYKELISYFEGKSTLAEAAEQIKLATRRYAKRQLTWFRHNADAVRLYVDRECGGLKDYVTLIGEALAIASELLQKNQKTEF